MEVVSLFVQSRGKFNKVTVSKDWYNKILDTLIKPEHFRWRYMCFEVTLDENQQEDFLFN